MLFSCIYPYMLVCKCKIISKLLLMIRKHNAYGSGSQMIMVVGLNNKGLKWESKVNHIDYILNQRLDDDVLGISGKIHFVSSVKMFDNLSNVQLVVLTNLSGQYCYSVYGCTLWKLDKTCTNDICTR